MVKRTDIDVLRATITDIDALCQESCDHIQAITDLLKNALGDADVSKQATTIENAIRLVNHLAANLQNNVNAEAEQVGCNWRAEAPVTLQGVGHD